MTIGAKKNWFFSVAILTNCLGFYFMATKYVVSPPIFIPLSWGILKDLLDPFLVISFPWNGWVVIIPALFFICFKLGVSVIFILWIISAILMGAASAITGFTNYAWGNLMSGVGFYMVIFGISLVPAVLLAGFRNNSE